ncbi:MAG: hypothetical protein ACOYL3_23500 [Desulfuromonadaceae bacterium]
MKAFKKMIAVMTLVSLLSTVSSAYAADDTIREVFTDAFYGAGIGALIGGALTVFTKHPSDHISNNLIYGAATGVLAGTAYGLAKSARAFAEVENGRVKIALPTIIPELVVSPSSGRTEVAWKAELIRGTFN